MMKLLTFTTCLLTLTACGKKDTCADLQLEICENCALSDREMDMTCACLEDGEVQNWQDYFSEKKEAEVHCSGVKNDNDGEYVGPDRLAECKGKLKVFKEHGSDACTLYGYESADWGSGNGEWDTGW